MSIPPGGGGERFVTGKHGEQHNENADLKRAETHATDALREVVHGQPNLVSQAIKGAEQAERAQGMSTPEIAASMEHLAAIMQKINDRLFAPTGPDHSSLMDRMQLNDPDSYKTVMDMLGASPAGQRILHSQSFALNENHSAADGAQFVQRLKRSTT